jgi:hypothetical protein
VTDDDNPKDFFPEHADASDGGFGIASAATNLVESEVTNHRRAVEARRLLSQSSEVRSDGGYQGRYPAP